MTVFNSYLAFENDRFEIDALYQAILAGEFGGITGMPKQPMLRAIYRPLHAMTDPYTNDDNRKAKVNEFLSEVGAKIDAMILLLQNGHIPAHVEGPLGDGVRYVHHEIIDIKGFKHSLADEEASAAIIVNLVKQKDHVVELRKKPAEIVKWAESIANPPAVKVEAKKEEIAKPKVVKAKDKPKFITLWVYPNEDNSKQFRATATRMIECYKKNIWCGNIYGRQRADQLQAQVDGALTVDELKDIIEKFIITGKTEIDRHCYSFFRSPSRSSGTGESSLRGMMIKKFIQRDVYPKHDKQWLDAVFIRQMVANGFKYCSIKTPITTPVATVEEANYANAPAP